MLECHITMQKKFDVADSGHWGQMRCVIVVVVVGGGRAVQRLMHMMGWLVVVVVGVEVD